MTHEEVSDETKIVNVEHSTLEIGPPRFDIDARLSRSQWQVIVFPVESSCCSSYSLTLKIFTFPWYARSLFCDIRRKSSFMPFMELQVSRWQISTNLEYSRCRPRLYRRTRRRRSLYHIDRVKIYGFRHYQYSIRRLTIFFRIYVDRSCIRRIIYQTISIPPLSINFSKIILNNPTQLDLSFMSLPTKTRYLDVNNISLH